MSGADSLAMYQPQYPASNVIGGIVRLVISRGEHFFEGFRPALRFNLIVAVGPNQLIGRGWIVLVFECVIQITKPFIRAACHRSVFMGPVTFFLLLSLWLATVFFIPVLVSARVVLWHCFY